MENIARLKYLVIISLPIQGLLHTKLSHSCTTLLNGYFLIPVRKKIRFEWTATKFEVFRIVNKPPNKRLIEAFIPSPETLVMYAGDFNLHSVE